MSAFFCKKSMIFGQNSTFTQRNSVRLVSQIFQFCFPFLEYERSLLMKICFTDYASGIQLPECSKLVENRKNGNDVTISQHDVTINFLKCCFVFLVRFSYGSKFHVNIMTGSGVMTISFFKALTRNLEIRNTPV